VIVPSKMLSPICGIMTSTAIARTSSNPDHFIFEYETRIASARVCKALRLGGAQTLFVPDAGHALEGVDLVSAVEKLDGLYLGGAAGVLKLLRLELVVVLTGLKERFQKGAIGDADFRTNLKLRFVQPLRFSQGARPAFFQISILPVRARLRQLFRRSAETVLPV
jgi:hypothetical protein